MVLQQNVQTLSLRYMAAVNTNFLLNDEGQTQIPQLHLHLQTTRPNRSAEQAQQGCN